MPSRAAISRTAISRTGIDVLSTVAAQPDGGGSRARYRREALEIVEREGLLETAWSYRIVPLEADAVAGAPLRLGGEALDAGRLIPDSGRLTALGCAVCTIGPALERRVSALFAERRMSLALALDGVGNALLLELARRLQDGMQADARRRGLTMAGELRPGDPGMGLDAQAAVLRLAEAASIGVTVVSGGGSLRPQKSATMVLGVGVDLPPARWSRCDDCGNRNKCRVAREAVAT